MLINNDKKYTTIEEIVDEADAKIKMLILGEEIKNEQ